LAAGFCPDPLGSLSAPQTPDHNMGPTSKGRGGMGRRKGEGEAPQPDFLATPLVLI